MKFKNIFLILALSLAFTACNNSKDMANNDNKVTSDENATKVNEKEEKSTIYASFYPIYNLTKQIAGDKFEVKSFTNLKTESHDWEPSAKDMAEVSKAKLMFINGAGMEEWEDSLKNSSDIELVNTSKDIDLIKASEEDHHDHDEDHDHEDADHDHDEDHDHEDADHDHDEDHDHEDADHDHDEDHDHEDADHDHDEDHDHEDADHDHDEDHDHEDADHDHDEDHDHEDADHDHDEDNDHEDTDHDHDEDHDHEDANEEEHHHHHGEYDPHLWLSPKNAISQAKVIAEKLSEIDPSNKDYYMDNFKKIEDELEALIAEYKDKFDECENKNFLVNHKAFSYLAKDFSLNQIALTSLTSTEETDAKTLKEASLKAKELNIKTIFYEMGSSDKNAKTLADEIGADTKPLNTLELATDENIKKDTTYQELVRENLEAIYQSLVK
ncbi:metal ABC transporter solute-binding protein, Zn/Mn family [Anaerococcus sp. Marseille-P9784]|uniref:metal ABC transporter solute-binding protein, Zn/Mn family n=1 Tax=Anaerococcus sp. Marseille-P9784 TaxID=2614127 RepID=UPI001249DAB8|nr:zinc ABC transporter substrate-binding protein [Anaerococcus sp. Marseille-P9784]